MEQSEGGEGGPAAALQAGLTGTTQGPPLQRPDCPQRLCYLRVLSFLCFVFVFLRKNSSQKNILLIAFIIKLNKLILQFQNLN